MRQISLSDPGTPLEAVPDSFSISAFCFQLLVLPGQKKNLP
jgi:hypothetical protein